MDSVLSDPRRALLDEQISALNALADAAERAYKGVAYLVVTAPNCEHVYSSSRRAGRAVETVCVDSTIEPNEVARLVADLLFRNRPELRECLDAARHWLAESRAVELRTPTLAVAPSACVGALQLLDNIADAVHLYLVQPDRPDGLADFDSADDLAAELAVCWREKLPRWLRIEPHDAMLGDLGVTGPKTDRLDALAYQARQECDAAIARWAREFDATRSSSSSTDLVSLADVAKLLGHSSLKRLQNELTEWRKQGHTVGNPCSYAIILPLVQQSWPSKATRFGPTIDDFRQAVANLR